MTANPISSSRGTTKYRVGVLDYGAGNPLSVLRFLDELDYEVSLVRAAEEFTLNRDLMVIPGVGNFGTASANLFGSGMASRVIDYAKGEHGKLLGICLGMQLLSDGSDESPEAPGLGLISGRCLKIKDDSGGLNLPIVGWQKVELRGFAEPPQEWFFSHSFEMRPSNQNQVVGIARNELGKQNAAVLSNNVLGVQFHPEKSKSAGRRLLQEFMSG